MKLNNNVGSVSRGNEAFYIKEFIIKNNKSSFLYIARNDQEIFDFKKKIEWLVPEIETLVYRSWDQIPYDNISPSKEIQSERIKTLYKLINNDQKKIIISSVNAILQKTVDHKFLKDNFIIINLGRVIPINQLVNKIQYEQKDSIYCDIDYIDNNNPPKLIRRWVSGPYNKKNFKLGWMPPHTGTLFSSKLLFSASLIILLSIKFIAR